MTPQEYYEAEQVRLAGERWVELSDEQIDQLWRDEGHLTLPQKLNRRSIVRTALAAFKSRNE